MRTPVRHDKILEAAIDACGGVVVSRTGDGMAATFGSALPSPPSNDPARRLGRALFGCSAWCRHLVALLLRRCCHPLVVADDLL
jgi:class 3 adenylate cyclase